MQVLLSEYEVTYYTELQKRYNKACELMKEYRHDEILSKSQVDKLFNALFDKTEDQGSDSNQKETT